MGDSTLECDQAIFTSVRTPMGEGYRVIAASAGLKSDEKQAITRYSPSHGSLCVSGASEADITSDCALSFYALPTGRLCVGLSFPAGAEHTGRGGERVYTHVVVFAADDFGRCAFNPFAIARAMAGAGLTEPQLKPSPKLSELTLTIRDADLDPDGASVGALPTLVGRQVLLGLLEQRSVAVNTPDGWCEAGEALWLGIPGPLRMRLTLSAGLRFSVSRAHNLQLLFDDKGHAKTRSVGQRIEYVNAIHSVGESGATPAVATQPQPRMDGSSAWFTFVERHWRDCAFSRLGQRTSQPFKDVAPTARERVGRLYNTLDELPSQDADGLLRAASEYLDRDPDCPVEAGIVGELVETARQSLLPKLTKPDWPEQRPLWKTLLQLWRRSSRGAAFVWPLVEGMLRGLGSFDALAAAEAALDLVDDVPPSADRPAVESLVNETLVRLGDWADGLSAECATGTPESGHSQHGALVERFREVVTKWRNRTIDPATKDRLTELYDAMATAGCASEADAH